MSEKRPQDTPTNREMLESLLTIEGSTGSTYSRFHRYSPRNIGFLAMQGCPPEPVATYGRWGELGRHVTKGSKAFSILRPINVKVEDEKADEGYRLIRRFKVVRALFHYSQTAGDDLPPYEPPAWDTEAALAHLDITRIPFESYEANMGGYARGRELAINPMAPYPFRTLAHEMSHIQSRHTSPEEMTEYLTHRGRKEVEAELGAYVVLKELDELDDETAAVSRGYAQSWAGNDELADESVRTILTSSGSILDAFWNTRRELLAESA